MICILYQLKGSDELKEEKGCHARVGVAHLCLLFPATAANKSHLRGFEGWPFTDFKSLVHPRQKEFEVPTLCKKRNGLQPRE